MSHVTEKVSYIMAAGKERKEEREEEKERGKEKERRERMGWNPNALI